MYDSMSAVLHTRLLRVLNYCRVFIGWLLLVLAWAPFYLWMPGMLRPWPLRPHFDQLHPLPLPLPCFDIFLAFQLCLEG